MPAVFAIGKCDKNIDKVVASLYQDFSKFVSRGAYYITGHLIIGDRSYDENCVEGYFSMTLSYPDKRMVKKGYNVFIVIQSRSLDLCRSALGIISCDANIRDIQIRYG